MSDIGDGANGVSMIVEAHVDLDFLLVHLWLMSYLNGPETRTLIMSGQWL